MQFKQIIGLTNVRLDGRLTEPNWDRPLWCLDRGWSGFCLWLYFRLSGEFEHLPCAMVYIKYHQRPYAGCKETGWC